MSSFYKFVHAATSSLVLFSLTLSALPVPTVSAQDQEDGIVRDYNAETGKVSMISGADDEPITILSAMSTNMTDEDRADALVQSFAPEFGVTDPAGDLQVMEQSQADGSRVITRYQQTYNDIPVMAGELIVNASEQGALYSMNGEVAQGLSLNTNPTLSAEEAVTIARQGMVKWYEGQASDYAPSAEVELWIFDESLLKESIRPAMLVWRMEMIPADGSPIHELILVDAKTGNIPMHFNQIDTAHSQQGEQPTATPTEVPTQEPVVPTQTAEPSATPLPTETMEPVEEFQYTPTPQYPPTEVPSDLNAQASIYYVDIFNGNDSNDCTSVATPCQNIKQAIEKGNGQAGGDTIYVASGTYTWTNSSLPARLNWGNIIITDRGLTISGGWNAAFNAQNGVSILDGQNSRQCILANIGTTVIENFIIQNCSQGDGAGVYTVNGNFTLRNSTVKNNIGDHYGAGLYISNTNFTLINSTVSGNGNSTTDNGGGIYILGSSAIVNIQNSTIAYNTAQNGGGMERIDGTLNIINSIIANNTGTVSGADCKGTIANASHSIIENVSDCTITIDSNTLHIDPQINNALTNTMLVHALQQGSPAINAGTSSGCPATDQRGVSRPQFGICDIGAYEFDEQLSNRILINTGNNQTTNVNQAFSIPLSVRVLDTDSIPVQGVTVTFTVSSSGASGTFNDSGTNITTATSGVNGIATAAILNANANNGILIVTASTTQYGSVNFTAIIGTTDNRFVAATGTNNSNTCQNPSQPCQTIQFAIDQATANSTIFVTQDKFNSSTAASVVTINKSINLSGGWNSTFTGQVGATVIDGNNLKQGVKITSPATIDHFTIQNGISNAGGGVSISTSGNVLISNSTITKNKGITNSNAGGIYINTGDLTLRNSTISYNVGWDGGAISLRKSTSAKITIENSTIVFNSASRGGGIYQEASGGGPINIKNSIIANNTATLIRSDTDGPDCGSATIITSNNNIIGKTSSCTFPTGIGNQYNTDPFISISPIGIFSIHTLSPTSPAVNAGNPTTCTTTDQRGMLRLNDGNCDIGAYEHTLAGAATYYGIGSGNNQSIGPRFSPATPLSVYVTDSFGTPKSGVSITFTAPVSGPTVIFTDSGTNTITINTDSYGLATPDFVGNMQTGTYDIMITADGLSGTLYATLTNKALFVSTSGNNSGNCLNSLQPCKTINYAISQSTTGDTIWVASGTYKDTTTRVVNMGGSLNLIGGWNSNFSVQNGMSIIDGENIRTGIYATGLEVLIDHFIVQNGYNLYDASGIQSNAENLIITNSTIRNNSSKGDGGGLLSTANVSIQNSTIAYNKADTGGGIDSRCTFECLIVVINSTIVHNETSSKGAGISHPDDPNNFSKIRLWNAIIAGNMVTPKNQAPYSSNCIKVETVDHSIISDTTGCTIQSNNNSLLNIAPKISEYMVGVQRYFVLLSDSPAIDAGNSSYCPAMDIRGIIRPVGSICDIGPYEYKTPSVPTSLIISTGNNQRLATNTASLTQITANILDEYGSPMGGVEVTFTAPLSGASSTFASTGTNTVTVTTNASGIAFAPTFTTNHLPGTFNITATSAGIPPINFVITSIGWYVSPNGNDSNACNTPTVPCLTIASALSKIETGDIVYVETGTYTKNSGSDVVTITKDVTLSGGWNSTFTLQKGLSTINGQNERRGIGQYSDTKFSVYNFIIENGLATSSSTGGNNGGGIYADNLDLFNSIIRNNYATGDGGGIYSGGYTNVGGTFIFDTNIFNSIVKNNHAAGNGGGIGGSIFMNKTLVEYNIADNFGGGVYGHGILENSTIKNNSAVNGGGLYVTEPYTGVGLDLYEPKVTNTLIVRNSASQMGGGIYFHSDSGIVNNSTIVENTAAQYGGGGVYTDNDSSHNTHQIINTILANNSYDDCQGRVGSLEHSLVVAWSCLPILGGQWPILRVDPKLSNYIFGFPGYMPLMEDSPAINNGHLSSCASTDQRGLSRPQQGSCDIGAYEYAVPGPIHSTNILGLFSAYGSTPGYDFAQSMLISAVDVNGSPVPNSSITLNTPLSGPSGLFSNNSNTVTLSTNIYGVVDMPRFMPNNELGQYSITASPGNVSTVVSITNGIRYVDGENGSDADGNTCLNPALPCQTINVALSKARLGEGVWVSAGIYNEAITISRDVVISGGWINAFTERSGQTTLDGNNAHQVVVIERNTNVLIADINIANGYTARGAGIYNMGNLILNSVSIHHNTTFHDGAGIYQKSGSLKLINTTVSNNTSDSSGGGIYVHDGKVDIQNSTLTQNVVIGQDYFAIGGGLSNPFNKPVAISNTLIAGNIAASDPDCRGLITSKGHNLIGFNDNCNITPASGDQIGASPLSAMLGNLADNGGTTLTHALLINSPAIDAGNAATCEIMDQRGIPRSQGTSCDIGAFEGGSTQAVVATVRTYTSGNSGVMPGTLICDQGTPVCTGGTDLSADSAHLFAIGTYQLYLDKHTRNGIDNNNMPIISSIHYQPEDGIPYANAFWTGSQLVYGDAFNFSLADDIVAHELTHGVTQYESNLFYFYQSGAISESLSDIWGEYYDQTNGIGTDDKNINNQNVKWLLGEDILPGGTGAFRSMSNPPNFNDPDRMISGLYIKTDEDGGGVHSNSGVNNKAVFLMVDGSTFGGYTVTGIGWEKVAAIYYEVQTNLLSSGSDYSDLYYAVQQACTTLSLTNFKGITSSDCTEVKKALDAVQMNSQPAANFNPDAPLCPSNSITAPSITYFNDDFENGLNKWEPNFSYRKWEIDNRYSANGIHSIWGTDEHASRTSGHEMLNGIQLPSGTSYLYFKHAFAFEYYGSKYYDGGIVEYSTDNGTTWYGVKSLFSAGKNYTGTIYNSTYSENELKGMQAFVGDSHGYISTRYNLTPLAGKTVKFRWLLATDQLYNYLGWFVDDIKIYSCVGSPSIPAYVTPASNSLVTDYTPLLDWSDATPNVHHYQLQVATDNTFTSSIYDVNNLITSQYTISNDLTPNTTYYWRVRAFNTLDETKGWSAARSFRTALTTPTGMSLPPLENNRPTFDWTDVLGATGYTIQISTVNTFASFVSKVTVASSTYTPTIDLPANKTLYWRVFANGLNGPSLPSTVSSFTTLNPPSIPVLSAPVDNLLVTSGSLLPPKLDWSNATVPAVVAFNGYQLQVATDAAFTSIVLDQNIPGLPSASEFTLSTPLVQNTKYFWRVRSYGNGTHNSSWSLTRSFRIALPAPTILAAPANAATLQLNRPLFDWDDVPGATSYTLQVSTVSTFASFALNTSASNSSFVPTVDLPANKTLYWRVIANGLNGPSLPSAFSSFSTANPPSVPTLATPVDNLLVTAASLLPPKFDWNNSTVPAGVSFGGYQLQVATDATFSSIVLDQNIPGLASGSEFTLSAPLTQNMKYFWRVRSYNNASHPSSWSATRSFRIALPAGTLVSPSGPLLTNLPTFDWNDVSGATDYTVQISTVNTFASTILKATATGSIFTPTTALPANKTLFWRVIANGPNGPSLPSASLSFTTGNPPSVPTLTAPLDNVLISHTLTPKLDWNNSIIPTGTTFDHYEVQWATDAAFSTGLGSQNVNGISTSEFTFTSALSQNTKYFWHVRSVNAAGQYSGWSLTRSFRLVMPAPNLTSPTGSISANLPTFDWDDVAGATYYSIQISSSSTFATTLVNTTASSSTFTPSTPLPANTALYWRVLAQGPNGPSSWSSSSTFTIQ